MAGQQDYAPKPAVSIGIFVTPCEFVTPGLVGFGSYGIPDGDLGIWSARRVATPKPDVSTGALVTPGGFVNPGLVGVGSGEIPEGIFGNAQGLQDYDA